MMTEFMHGAGEDLRPSKSQRKRDMLALQELGRRLLELSPERIARMDLPDDLAEAEKVPFSVSFANTAS